VFCGRKIQGLVVPIAAVTPSNPVAVGETAGLFLSLYQNVACANAVKCALFSGCAVLDARLN
jgi:hypothetical protein